MQEQSIKVGDVVFLKSSSQPMTVDTVFTSGDGSPSVNVVWMSDGKISSYMLPIDCITTEVY